MYQVVRFTYFPMSMIRERTGTRSVGLKGTDPSHWLTRTKQILKDKIETLQE